MSLQNKLRFYDILRLPMLALFGTITFVLCWVLNRVSVSGRQNVPYGTNVILASRHQSLIDSFPVTIASMHLRDLFLPWLLPWHTADRSNYMNNKFSYAWGWFMKIIPISPTRIDLPSLNRMVTLTRDSRLFVFPGGTRERSGRPVKPRAGIGHVAMETGATIVPVWIDGMDQVLPIGCNWPRLFKRIRIVFGKPVYYQDILETQDPNDSRPSKKAIAQRVTKSIYALSESSTPNPEIQST